MLGKQVSGFRKGGIDWNFSMTTSSDKGVTRREIKQALLDAVQLCTLLVSLPQCEVRVIRDTRCGLDRGRQAPTLKLSPRSTTRTNPHLARMV